MAHDKQMYLFLNLETMFDNSNGTLNASIIQLSLLKLTKKML